MKMCLKCGKEYPIKVVVNGKQRNLQRRKYCLDCSPFERHNTRQLVLKDQAKNISEKSEKQGICQICQRLRKRRGRLCRSCSTKVRRYRAKQAAVQYLGGKCQRCGWDGLLATYEFHHTDPSRKDFAIGNVSNRKWELILQELDKCELLCANCHSVEHSDHSDLVKQEASRYKGRLLNFLREEGSILRTNSCKTDVIHKDRQKNCSYCGKYLTNKNQDTYCSQQCSKLALRRTIRPSKEELKKLIWTKPTTHIAKDFGVSDKAVEKWCKAYGIDKPPRGYWAKLASV